MSNNKIPILVTGFLLLVSVIILLFFVVRGVGKPQNAVPSKAAETDVTKCQGNSDASAKCFDCKKDATPSSVVNVLDFSCFTKFYGKSVN